MKIIISDLFIRIPKGDLLPHIGYIINYFCVTYEEEEDITNSEGDILDTELVTKTKYYIFEEKDYYCMYSGLRKRLLFFLSELNIPYEIIDNSQNTRQVLDLEYDVDKDIHKPFSLREDYQLPAVSSILKNRKSLLFIPTRGGKTEIIIAAVSHYLKHENPEGNITVIVKKTKLAENFYQRFVKRGYYNTGMFFNQNKDYHSNVLCCVINSVYNLYKKLTEGESLSRKDKQMLDRINSTDVLIIDEVQDASSSMFQFTIPNILNINHPDLMISCSGTPFTSELNPHANKHDMDILQLFGSTTLKVNDEYLIQKGYKARGNVIWLDYPNDGKSIFSRSYHKLYKKAITDNSYRNILASEIVSRLHSKGIKCLVLVNRLDHGKNFLRLLNKIENIRAIFTSSKESYTLSNKKVSKIEERDFIEDFNNGELDILIGTNILNVGVDFPSCHFMIMLAGEGMDNDILNRQRTSRILCPNTKYNNNGYFVDFLDKYSETTLKHSYSRQELYNSSNYIQHFGMDKFNEIINKY